MKTKIKELREKRNLTQEGLAEKVDVTRQTILFLEKGKYNPSLRLAYRIAKMLNSKIEEIFSFEDERLRNLGANRIMSTSDPNSPTRERNEKVWTTTCDCEPSKCRLPRLEGCSAQLDLPQQNGAYRFGVD